MCVCVCVCDPQVLLSTIVEHVQGSRGGSAPAAAPQSQRIGPAARRTSVSAYAASTHKEVTEIHTHAWTVKSMRHVGKMVADSRKERDVTLLSKFPIHMRPVVACQFLSTYVSEMTDKATNAFPVSGGLYGELMKSIFADVMKVRRARRCAVPLAWWGADRRGVCVGHGRLFKFVQ